MHALALPAVCAARQGASARPRARPRAAPTRTSQLLGAAVPYRYGPPSGAPQRPKLVTVWLMMSQHSRNCASLMTSGGAKRMMFFCGVEADEGGDA